MKILQIILDFIKTNFLLAIIIFLMILLLLERCSKPISNTPQPIIKHDTTYIKKDSIIYSKPKLIKTVGESKIDTFFLPNPNYDKLLKQYRDLLNLYFAKNITNDTLKLDKYGNIFIIDTITKNLIAGRKYTYNLVIPEVTTTIISPPKLVNQMYVGGSLSGNQYGISQFNAGVLLKNKRDQIFGIYAGADSRLQIVYGIQSYWKIKFRK